tara:strand:+ start:672 stop:803 length:132 start_codon:yes stop_codon:yes gene_type:complete
MTDKKVLDFPQTSDTDQQFLDLERQQKEIREQSREIAKKGSKK